MEFKEFQHEELLVELTPEQLKELKGGDFFAYFPNGIPSPDYIGLPIPSNPSPFQPGFPIGVPAFVF